MEGAPHNQPRDYYFHAYFRARGIRHWFHQRRIDALLALIPAGTSVLDAGCGSGLTSHLLAKKGCAVTGIDIDKAEVDFARETTPGARFEVADLETLDLHAAFDVVLCSEALEHFPPARQETVVRRLAAHVKPGGMLLLTFPSSFYLALEPAWKIVRRVLSPGITWDDEDCHEDVGPGRARALLAQNGFAVAATTTMVLGLIAVISGRAPAGTSPESPGPAAPNPR